MKQAWPDHTTGIKKNAFGLGCCSFANKIRPHFISPCDGIVRVAAYAFRHDCVLCHLYTHNRAFPFIKHALYSGRNGHTRESAHKEI